MPRVIEIADDAVIGLEECVAVMRDAGFDPADEASLLHAARQLRRLGNNRSFLGDLLVAELADRHRQEDDRNSYGPQVIMLASAEGGPFFMRANIWPSADEHVMRASGGHSFVYGLPHDHNFDFLTIGYFGPGYWSDYYEFDYEKTIGWQGEPVELRFVERSRLEEGRILHYRAHRDVHAQIPADSLSVSINILHASDAQGWFDQYSFDVEAGRIGRILSNGASEAFLRIAVGLGCAPAFDLAERFGRHHPSDRMRLAAWGALASVADGPAERDRIWQAAEACGSRLVAAEAKRRREALGAREASAVQ
ncbi:MAG: transposase [Novosphingobium sp.]|nr:transposase [Novosphingobium sp.]